VVSQTSTAVTVGAVIIPILLAARIPPVTVGATLLLGSSIGGELLNPGAPELRTVVEESTAACLALGLSDPGRTEVLVARILPLNLLGLGVAITVAWAMSLRRDPSADASATETDLTPDFRVNVFKAMIPVLPLVLLFLTAPPFKLLSVPPKWLLGNVGDGPLTPAQNGLFDCRLIGAAMLVGVVVAALSTPRASRQVASSFFDGAGYGFTHIISLIVTATCFGEAVRLIGLASLLGDLIKQVPFLLMPLAGLLPLGFGMLCGSGMATTQSLFNFFVYPALDLGIDPFLVGAIVSLASGAGRTISPFAAVTLMCATLTRTSALQLSARVIPPLVAAVIAEVIAAMIMVAMHQ
jgi:DcuC family C4-dicarboxylate transporter